MYARLLPLLLLVLATAPQIRAEDFAGADARLLADLKFLTSPDCQGRGIETKGVHLAADYLVREMLNAGLKPGGIKGSWYQPFDLALGVKLGVHNQLALKGPLGQSITLQPGKSYGVLPLGGTGKAEAALIFAGFGIVSADPKYDDYAGLDVKGKIVVVLTDGPRRGNPHVDEFPYMDDWGPRSALSLRSKVDNARKHGAAGLLVVNSRRRGRFQDPIPRPTISPLDDAPHGIPVAQMPRDLADAIVFSVTGQNLDYFEQQIDANMQPRSLALPGWTCRLETEVVYNQAPVKNVIGVLEGSGPLAKETVVIGAHYDHVGYLGTTRKFPVKTGAFSGPSGIGGVGFPLAQAMETALHHGADDNASGTVTLLEVARHFGAIKNRQGRRLVFIAFTAEESGLVGSDYYTRHPQFPLADTTAMINMDMVGRLQDDRLKVGGLATAKTFLPLIEKLNDKHRFQLAKEMSGLGGSDHAVFYGNRIPVVNFFTGFHEQYHCPTDRWETVNVPGMRRIAALVADVASELTTNTVRPEYAKAPPYDRTHSLWANAPCTGIVPAYTPSKDGVLIAEVLKNTPAAKAGMQKGDRILALGGKKVEDAIDFLSATRALEPGQMIEALVERQGNSQSIKVQLAKKPLGIDEPRFGFVFDPANLKEGMLVVDVPEKTAAAAAGLQKADRIKAIGGTPIEDRDSFIAATTGLRSGEAVEFTVERGNKMLQFQVRLGTEGKKGKK